MISFNNFEQVFLKAKKPYWVLYKGTSKGSQQIGSNLQEDDSEGKLDMSDSLHSLRELIELYGDGTYTVECRPNPRASRGNDTHTFFVGEPSKSASVQAARQDHPISGFFAGLDGKYFLDQIGALRDEHQRAQIALLRKEMEIAELKRQLKEDNQPGIGEKILGIVEKNPALLDRVFGGSAPTAIGHLKAKKGQNEVPENRAEENDEEEYAYEPGKLDFNALVESAMRIQQLLPDMHVNEVFDALADFLEDNPDQAKGYLKMLLGR